MNTGGENIFANFNLDVKHRVLRRGGEIVPLPLKAVELLIVLLENRGEVVSKNDLLEAVWQETFVEESVLSNNVYILRKTLSELGAGKVFDSNRAAPGLSVQRKFRTAGR